MVKSLQKAWELVGDKLRDHGKFLATPSLSFLPFHTTSPSPSPLITHAHNTARLRVDEKHLLPSLTLDTPLEYLIPTTTGAGACTTALTDFLVLTHNNFIENCRSIVSKQYKR